MLPGMLWILPCSHFDQVTMKTVIAIILAASCGASSAAGGCTEWPSIPVTLNGTQYSCPIKGAEQAQSGALLVDFTRNSQANGQGVTECRRLEVAKTVKNESAQGRFERLSRAHPNWP